MQGSFTAHEVVLKDMHKMTGTKQQQYKTNCEPSVSWDLVYLNAC